MDCRKTFSVVSLNLVLVLLFAHLSFIHRTCAQSTDVDIVTGQNVSLPGSEWGTKTPLPTNTTNTTNTTNANTLTSDTPMTPITDISTSSIDVAQPTVSTEMTTKNVAAIDPNTIRDFRDKTTINNQTDAEMLPGISRDRVILPTGDMNRTTHNDTLWENELRPGTAGNCSGFPILADDLQPFQTATSRIRKCCPFGENYDVSNDTDNYRCTAENVPFNVPIIDAIFYQHCIVDTEKPINLSFEIGFGCDDAFLYNENFGDLLYVLQNGSLLRIREDYSAYDVSDDYCLDMHREDKVISALVCTKQDTVPVSRAEAYLYATCLLVSVPCLFVTTFFYIHINELRNLHGKSLACHSLCLAIAFLLIGVAQIRGRVPQSVGYVIQYFMLACFCWVAVMCADICIHVWWHLPKYQNITQKVKTRRFIIYCIVSFGVPLILVLMAFAVQQPGQPSYYLKGVKENARTPLNYFIPPISSILFICFGLMVASYFGFRNILELDAKEYIMQKSFEDGATFYNQADHCYKLHIADVERTARSTAYLYLIMTINWIFEIISFYTQTPSSSSLVLFDVLNALQGVVIFIIFLCLPRPKRIITRWWKSEGTFECNHTEMEVLNNHSQIKK